MQLQRLQQSLSLNNVTNLPELCQPPIAIQLDIKTCKIEYFECITISELSTKYKLQLNHFNEFANYLGSSINTPINIEELEVIFSTLPYFILIVS